MRGQSDSKMDSPTDREKKFSVQPILHSSKLHLILKWQQSENVT
jgi:hypothetical protein